MKKLWLGVAVLEHMSDLLVSVGSSEATLWPTLSSLLPRAQEWFSRPPALAVSADTTTPNQS